MSVKCVVAMAILLLVLGSTSARGEADLSTPKSATKALWTAVAAGEAGNIRDVLHSEGEAQHELIASFADLLVAGKNLSDAAREQFAEKGDIIARPMVDPKDLTKIDAADVKESGDTATLTLAGGTKPMTFRKTGNQWRLVVTDYSNAAAENLPRQLKLLRTMTASMNESAKEIHAGKYESASAAQVAIQQKLHAVMIDSYRPATAPATAPAIAPTTQPRAAP